MVEQNASGKRVAARGGRKWQSIVTVKNSLHLLQTIDVYMGGINMIWITVIIRYLPTLCCYFSQLLQRQHWKRRWSRRRCFQPFIMIKLSVMWAPKKLQNIDFCFKSIISSNPTMYEDKLHRYLIALQYSTSSSPPSHCGWAGRGVGRAKDHHLVNLVK